MGPAIEKKAISVKHEVLFICDIDGVLTNSNSPNQGVDRDALAALHAEVCRGGRLALATGRPFAWVEKEIFKSDCFTEKQKSETIVASENGAVISIFQNGAWETKVNSQVRIPEEVARALMNLAYKYSDCMFYDSDKLTMGTLVELEGSPGVKPKFQSLKGELTNRLQGEFQIHPQLRVSNTAIAIDVCHVDATKRLAAQEIINRIGGGRRVRIFGDSTTDGDLAIGAAELLPYGDIAFNFLGDRELDSSMADQLQSKGIHILRSKTAFSPGLRGLLRAA